MGTLCTVVLAHAPTEYVIKGNYDGHIVLTDLQAPKPKPSRCRRMDGFKV